jgi:16S rRNA U1498 N3-methylase RsmE
VTNTSLFFPGIHNYEQTWKHVACLRDKNELFFETLIAHLELRSKSGVVIGPEGGTTA